MYVYVYVCMYMCVCVYTYHIILTSPILWYFIEWIYKNLFYCLFLFSRKVKVEVLQLYPTLCDPMDYTVHGILQARILEWVAFAFSRGSYQSRDQTQVSLTTSRFFTSWVIREALISRGPWQNFQLRFWNILFAFLLLL